jgi:hypothetical protein
MIDFIKLLYVHSDISAFMDIHKRTRQTINHTPDTGEITFPYCFEYELYKIVIRYSALQNLHFVEISGSLHKNFYGGANFERFTFENLKCEIQKLCNGLQLAPEKLTIQNLEIGLNICTPFAPYEYLNQNLLLFSTKPFKPYKKSSDGKELGFFCEGLPIIKLYDKGKQYNLNYNLMRFEVRYKKTKPLNQLGIFTLNDLLSIKNIKKLAAILPITWAKVLMYENLKNCLNTSGNRSHLNFYNDCEHIKNWVKWLRSKKTRTPFYFNKKRFHAIINEYGKNVHKEISILINAETEVCTNFPDCDNLPMYNFTDTLNSNLVQNIELRTCKSCGNKLDPRQKLNSKFCSAKYAGEKAAHRCRNINSNPRNSAKYKIKKMKDMGLLFSINEIFTPSFLNKL